MSDRNVRTDGRASQAWTDQPIGFQNQRESLPFGVVLIKQAYWAKGGANQAGLMGNKECLYGYFPGACTYVHVDVCVLVVVGIA
ncbi:hypothetical protein SK128_005126 [Halocaridina rubra]|uniref:Uncharacterized protein n=1 Tax=Halocaridina rubra TaxID=373956 RepID=A0AAN8ZQX0_HALRR